MDSLVSVHYKDSWCLLIYQENLSAKTLVSTAKSIVSPYFGAQVSFAGLSESNSQTPTGGKNTETKSSGTAIGIGAVAGFDWYITNGIAIGGEYMLGFTTSSTSSTSAIGTTTDNPSITNIGISSVSVHLVVVM